MTRRRRVTLGSIAFLVLFVAGWWAYVVAADVSRQLVPTPGDLLDRFAYFWRRGTLQRDIRVTLQQILVGFAYGAIIGVAVGQLFGRVRILERLFTPLVVLLQTTPKISLAPLLVLWFGLGMTSKVVLVALVVFFPIMTHALIGVRTVDPDLIALSRLLRMNPLQRFVRIELPHSLPSILAGVRVSTTYAVTAAVVGELIGANAGLGYLLAVGQELSDVRVVLLATLVLSFLAYVLYAVVLFVERKLLAWHESQSQEVF